MTSCSALAVPRAGGIAWEYDFTFGGGRPPWVSGLAQGTGIQAMARTAKRNGREAEIYPLLRSALGVFKTNTPEGVRVPTSDGAEYALYSFAPRPARHQWLRAGARRASTTSARSPATPTRRRSTSRASASRGGRCRRSTPAPGRCTRRGSSEHESDLNTTSCCARSCAACATAPTTPSTATPSCASPRTARAAGRLARHRAKLRGGTLGKVKVRLSKPRVGPEVLRAAVVSCRRERRSWSATAR